MKRIKRLKNVIFLLLTVICMNYFCPQYSESEFPLFIDIFTTPVFGVFTFLNVVATAAILKFMKNSTLRITLVFIYFIEIILLFRVVIRGNENITQIRMWFIIIQMSILVIGLILNKIHWRGEN